MTNWLTPETAIGCRLPCGAVVVRAGEPDLEGDLALVFDRVPANGEVGELEYYFRHDGTHYHVTLPNLIPPSPAQPGVYVTREALAKALAVLKKSWREPVNEQSLADALGIPPDPPKVAPWEVAYEAWKDAPQSPVRGGCKVSFEAGVMFAVGQIEAEGGVPTQAIKRRIMGDQA